MYRNRFPIQENSQMSHFRTLDTGEWQENIDFGKLMQESKARNNSQITEFSEPHTPVEQVPSSFYSRSEFGSVSSIATTDDDDEPPNLYPWTEDQRQLVFESYRHVVDAPTATPFVSRHPPSGVIHQVCQYTLRVARRKNIPFPHSMDAMRQFIIQNFINDDYTLGNPYTEYRSNYLGTDQKPWRRGSVEENFNFFDNGPSKSVYESRNSKMNSRDLDGHLHNGQLADNNEAMLQPAFRDPERCNSIGDIGMNTSRRKRDSLNMKRGLY